MRQLGRTGHRVLSPAAVSCLSHILLVHLLCRLLFPVYLHSAPVPCRQFPIPPYAAVVCLLISPTAFRFLFSPVTIFCSLTLSPALSAVSCYILPPPVPCPAPTVVSCLLFPSPLSAVSGRRSPVLSRVRRLQRGGAVRCRAGRRRAAPPLLVAAGGRYWSLPPAGGRPGRRGGLASVPPDGAGPTVTGRSPDDRREVQRRPGPPAALAA